MHVLEYTNNTYALLGMCMVNEPNQFFGSVEFIKPFSSKANFFFGKSGSVWFKTSSENLYQALLQPS